MLNEDRIAELMRSNERPHTMLDDERARIRDVVDQGEELAFEDQVGPLVDVSADAPASNRRRSRPALLLAAAVTVLIASLALTQIGNDERPVLTVADAPETQTETQAERPAPTALPTPDPFLIGLEAGTAFCAGPFTDLANAIAGWDGITNWSYLTDSRNPEPHIPALSSVVLDELESIVDPDELKVSRAALEQTLNLITSQPAGITPDIRGAVADTLTTFVDAVRAAIEADLEAGYGRFDTCNLATFTADG